MEYRYAHDKPPCEVLSDKSDHIRQYTDGVCSNYDAIFEMSNRLVELFDIAEQQGGSERGVGSRGRRSGVSRGSSKTVKLPTTAMMRNCETLAEMSLVASYRSGVIEDLITTVMPRYKEVSEIPASMEECCDNVSEKTAVVLLLGRTTSKLAAAIMDRFVTIADSYTAFLHSIEEQMPAPAAVSRLLKTVADNSARIRERHKKVEEYTEALAILCLSAVPLSPEEIN